MTTVSDGLFQYGGSPVAGSDLMPGNEYMVCAASGAPASYWGNKWPKGKFKNTIAEAYALTTSNQNDVVHVAPGAYGVTATLTWANSNTHLIGAHAPSPWANSVAYTLSGNSAAVSPGITVSGSDCYFRNIHFVDSQAHADHHNFLYNTGSGNTYENCWFEGPTNATQNDDTSYETVLVDGGGNYFKNCAFGTTASACGGAAKLGFTGSAYRSTFENCIFYHQADNVAAVFIDLSAEFDISGPQFFNSCKFISWWNNAADRITVAIRKGNATGYMVFDPNCMFVGCNAISAEDTNMVFCGHPLTAAHDGVYAGLVECLGGTEP